MNECANVKNIQSHLRNASLILFSSFGVLLYFVVPFLTLLSLCKFPEMEAGQDCVRLAKIV